jgi:sugar transferase (PEP-CTERM/EpsH1 system associated)
MSDVLFLAHRIPYPPNKGDKIRSWRLFKSLTERHRVHLGAFVDMKEDLQHLQGLRARCASSHFTFRSPRASKLQGALRAIGGASITEGAYRDGGMADFVRRTLESVAVESVFAFSSGVAQYAELPGIRYPRRVIDLCDVDSDKWRQYAERTSGAARWVYSLENRRLAQAETRWVRTFDAVIVISEAERRLLPPSVASDRKVAAIANGVDASFFDPAVSLPGVFEPGIRPIVFTGAMDYFANVDGVEWFANEVFPHIHAACPDSVFAIVGSNPAPRVRALATRPGIRVTGAVPDVRPYLAQAACAVVCLRIARGVQNKLLEAMSMARPVVSTTIATAGVAEHGALAGVVIEDRPREFADRVIAQLRSSPGPNQAARRFVLEKFSWERNLSQFVSLVEGRAA